MFWLLSFFPSAEWLVGAELLLDSKKLTGLRRLTKTKCSSDFSPPDITALLQASCQCRYRDFSLSDKSFKKDQIQYVRSRCRWRRASLQNLQVLHLPLMQHGYAWVQYVLSPQGVTKTQIPNCCCLKREVTWNPKMFYPAVRFVRNILF